MRMVNFGIEVLKEHHIPLMIFLYNVSLRCLLQIDAMLVDAFLHWEKYFFALHPRTIDWRRTTLSLIWARSSDATNARHFA
jgi:hypothetical protein